MGLDDMLWNFGNDLTNKGIPNYIHWDFSRREEITGPWVRIPHLPPNN